MASVDASEIRCLLRGCEIAATVIVHELKVVTPNVAEFALFNVKLLNPFENPPGKGR